MKEQDPNIELLELAAAALEPLLDQLVLVGGCAVGLMVTDMARPPIRPTNDVDVVTIVTKSGYYSLRARLIRELGFQDHDVTCRFRKDGLLLDVMPADPEILGFSNKWYALVVETSCQAKLPSGRILRHASGPLLIATKLEAFHSRGNGDYAHHDLEDIINLVDGRPEIVDEVAIATDEVRQYIQYEIDELLAEQAFTDTIPMHFHPDLINQARVSLVISRLRKIAGI